MFALLLEKSNEIRLGNNEWVEKLNCLNTNFQLLAKSEDTLRKRLNSKSLKQYTTIKDQMIAFKSEEKLKIFVSFVSQKQEYIDYFIQHATKQGLYRYCRTSRQVNTHTPVFSLNAGQIKELTKRLEFDVLMHPIVKDASIHNLISEIRKLKYIKLVLNSQYLISTDLLIIEF